MTNDHPPLLADTAISDTSQDRLDRAPFAHSLACSILGLEGNDSFVIGLCGPWGSGKTSVLNLLLGHLDALNEPQRPIVFRFNPWWFSGRNQLLESFLLQLGTALEVPERGKGAGKVSVLFQQMSIGLRPLAFVPFIGEAAKAGSDFSKSIGDAAKVYVDATKTDVLGARKQIDKALEALDRRLIIVMDDIDRLSADEIAELFLILKAVADFPKTVYLLAFDHRVVSRAIRQKLGVNGKTYLEKIVQLQIELPSVGYSAIQQMFLEQIGELLGPTEVSDGLKQDFGNLFHDGVKHFLTTPRASKKLLNTLRFVYPPLKGEVYFPDVVGVATLFAFVPSAVRVIANNSEAFTGTERYGEDRKELRAFHDKWLAKIGSKGREHVEGILKRLFPKFGWALDGPGYATDFEVTWRRQLRVCSSTHFDKYFIFGLPGGVISEAEWAEIVESITNEQQFEQRITRLTTEKGRHGFVSRSKELLDRLEDFARTSKETPKVEAVFRSVLRVGDRLIEVKDEEVIGGLFAWDNKTRVLRVLLRSIEHLRSEQERVRLLDSSVRQGYGLLTLTELVAALGQEHGMFGSSERDDDRQKPLLSAEKVQKLLKKVARKIRAAADGDETSELARHPYTLEIVGWWCDFGSQTAALRWLRRQARCEKFLIGLLYQASSKVRSHGMSDRVVREHLIVNTGYLGRFLNLRRLKGRCSRLLDAPPDWLSEEQKVLLRTAASLITDAGEPLNERDIRRNRLTCGDFESD